MIGTEVGHHHVAKYYLLSKTKSIYTVRNGLSTLTAEPHNQCHHKGKKKGPYERSHDLYIQPHPSLTEFQEITGENGDNEWKA